MLDFGAGSFFLTPSQLSNSPSARHGIPEEIEKSLRLYGCEVIQEAGILLRVPQAVPATAQVLFHRFFCKRSFRDFDVRISVASCFWLSMKLEEEQGASCRRGKLSALDDVVTIFEHLRFKREGDVAFPSHSPSFKMRKEEILKQESRILAELGFICHVEHPHKLLLGYLNCLQASKELVQEAWNLVNDSLRTTLCVSFSSNVIACGVVYAAARRLSVPLPDSPPWWLSFDVTFDDILSVCHVLADLYRQPKSRYINVKKWLESLVKAPRDPQSSAEDMTSLAGQPEEGENGVKDVSVVLQSVDTNVLNSCLMNDSGFDLSKVVVVNGSGDSQQDPEKKMDSTSSGSTGPTAVENFEVNSLGRRDSDRKSNSHESNERRREPSGECSDRSSQHSHESNDRNQENSHGFLQERKENSDCREHSRQSNDRSSENSHERNDRSREKSHEPIDICRPHYQGNNGRSREHLDTLRLPYHERNSSRRREYADSGARHGSRKRESADAEQDYYRGSEHRRKRREEHQLSHCRVDKYSSRSYDDRKYDNRSQYYCERVRG